MHAYNEMQIGQNSKMSLHTAQGRKKPPTFPPRPKSSKIRNSLPPRHVNSPLSFVPTLASLLRARFCRLGASRAGLGATFGGFAD